MLARAIAAARTARASRHPSNGDSAQTAAAKRGRQIYQNVCIACHNADPTQPGSLGPPLAGASLELIEAKVLRGEYPPGYTPCVPGRRCPGYEYLKDRLGDSPPTYNRTDCARYSTSVSPRPKWIVPLTRRERLLERLARSPRARSTPARPTSARNTIQ